MILSSGSFRLPRSWQNALLSLTCAGITTLCLTPTVASAQTNVAPVIVGQQPLSVSAGSPLAITLADLEVIDPDNSFPEGFTLRLLQDPDAFQLSGNTIVPNGLFEGTLEVAVIVNDGVADSDPFALTVNVTGVDSKGGGKKAEANGGPGSDKDDNKGPGKKDEEKKGGDKDKGPGKKDEGKKGDDKGPANEQDKDKGPGKKDDKKGGDKDKGPGKKDEGKKDDDQGGPGDNQDKDKGPGKKDEDPKAGDNGGPGNNQDKDKGPGKRDEEKKDEGNGKPENNKDENKGGGKNDEGQNNGGNSGPGNNQGGNNGGENTQSNPPPSNVPPVITGQHEITTARNVAVTLDLNMLKVDDPDNTYPDDFSLKVFAGNNYVLDGNRLTPAQDFTGTLEVRVQVNDGISNSNMFLLNIAVREGNVPPQILGQAPLATDEETPISIGFSDLIVFDPDSPYPDGFTIRISKGEHYTIEGTTVQPAENFSGPFAVTVTVNDGKLESDPYSLVISVNPVNDAPVLENMEQGVLPYLANAGPASVTERIKVTDVDGDNIVGAEISFDMATYESGHDLLSFESAQTDLGIEGVFDSDNGTLFLIGSAPASDYQKALRSVMYSFNHENAEVVNSTTKTLSVVVRDGHTESNVAIREIAFSGEIALDVPRAFTPNGDMANDTWSVKPIQNIEGYEDAITRIYNMRGQLLYEAIGFEWEWDGRYEGQVLPTGTYYYIISVKSGTNMSNRKGVVTIIR